MTLREVCWRLDEINKRQKQAMILDASMRGIKLPDDFTRGDAEPENDEFSAETERAIDQRLKERIDKFGVTTAGVV